MKKALSLLITLLYLVTSSCVTASAASPTYSIDTSDKTVIYENTFDSEASLRDFKQYNGTFGVKYGKVANLGVGVSNTPYWNALTEEISSYNADIIIVMSGSNDMGSKTTKLITNYLKDTFKQIQKATPDVHFILITEWFQPSRIEQYKSKVIEMEAAWRDLANNSPSSVTVVDGFSIPLDEDGNFSDALFTDTQHLGILGYKELAKRVSEAIDNVKAGVFLGGGAPIEEAPEESSDTTAPASDLPTAPASTDSTASAGASGGSAMLIIIISASAAAIAGVIIIVIKKKK